jgi:hypothetical protein
MSESLPLTVFENKSGCELTREKGQSQVLLQKDLKVKLLSEDKELSGKVADWYYEVPNILHIVVEFEEATFENLDSESQEMLSMGISLALVILTFAALLVIYVYSNYPIAFYGFIGYYMGWIIPILIITLGLIVLFKTKGYAKNRTIKGQIIGLFYTLIMWILLGVWYFYLRPPSGPKAYPDDYAKDVFGVGAKLYDNLIIPIVSIGWLGGIIKLIGWKGVADAFEAFVNIFKHNKKG